MPVPGAAGSSSDVWDIPGPPLFFSESQSSAHSFLAPLSSLLACFPRRRRSDLTACSSSSSLAGCQALSAKAPSLPYGLLHPSTSVCWRPAQASQPCLLIVPPFLIPTLLASQSGSLHHHLPRVPRASLLMLVLESCVLFSLILFF